MDICKTENPVYVFSNEERKAIWLLHEAGQKICNNYKFCKDCPFNRKLDNFSFCAFSDGMGTFSRLKSIGEEFERNGK